MLIFWHIIASFFFVLGLADLIYEIKRALTYKKSDGIFVIVMIDKENEKEAECVLRRASVFSDGVPVFAAFRNVSRETIEICRRICAEEGIEEL